MAEEQPLREVGRARGGSRRLPRSSSCCCGLPFFFSSLSVLRRRGGVAAVPSPAAPRCSRSLEPPPAARLPRLPPCSLHPPPPPPQHFSPASRVTQQPATEGHSESHSFDWSCEGLCEEWTLSRDTHHLRQPQRTGSAMQPIALSLSSSACLRPSTHAARRLSARVVCVNRACPPFWVLSGHRPVTGCIASGAVCAEYDIGEEPVHRAQYLTRSPPKFIARVILTASLCPLACAEPCC